MSTRLLSALVAVLFVSGCGGSDTAETTEDPGEIAFDLPEANDSNVVGARAILSYVDQNRTRILVDGIDPAEPGSGGANPVQLTRGSCDEPGDVVARLPPLRNASSAATVELGMAELQTNGYAIVVRLAGSGANTEAIACGDVPGG